MDPLASADRAARVVVDYGALGAVLLGASVIIAGLMVAVVVLWRAREASERMREQTVRQHYDAVLAMVAEQAAREHKLADALQQHVSAITTVRELLIQIIGSRGHD